MKKIIILVIIVSFLLNITPIPISASVKEPSLPIYRTLYVGGTGPGNYSNIQAAIDAASNGDTIFVYNGVYSGFTVNKILTIIGESREETVVIAIEIGLFSTGINLTNFTLKGNFYNSVDKLLDIRGNYCNISYCNIVPASNNMPLNGIKIGWCSNSTISNCDIIGFPYWAITCMDVANCYIENCTIGNSYRGVYTMGPNEHVYVINCEIYNCGWDDYIPSGGIFLDCSDYNHIINCDIHDNAIGIKAQSLHGYNGHNEFISNNFSYNEYGVQIYGGCHNNYVYHNNFVMSSGQNAYDVGNNNIWDNGYPSGGNHWSDYDGVDEYSGEYQNITGSDGIGDTPYTIPGQGYQDRYPIMGNVRPHPPNISGPTSGKPGVSYDYYLSSTDPDSDDVYYYVDWGDNTNSGWLGLYSSGAMITVSHTWDQKGTYTIKAKAKDSYGYESEWTTLAVTMPLDLPSSRSNPTPQTQPSIQPSSEPISKTTIQTIIGSTTLLGKTTSK